MKITGVVVVWRRWKTRGIAWCRREWRRVVAGMLIAAMLWVPASTPRRAETDAPGDAFGPIHYWQGSRP